MGFFPIDDALGASVTASSDSCELIASRSWSRTKRQTTHHEAHRDPLRSHVRRCWAWTRGTLCRGCSSRMSVTARWTWTRQERLCGRCADCRERTLAGSTLSYIAGGVRARVSWDVRSHGRSLWPQTPPTASAYGSRPIPRPQPPQGGAPKAHPAFLGLGIPECL